MSISAPKIREIVDSAVGSLANAQVSQGMLGTNILLDGVCVVTISPFRGQLLIQCVEGLGIQPRKGHLIRQRSREEGWETWVTATHIGIASFVHQAAPALGQRSPSPDGYKPRDSDKPRDLAPSTEVATAVRQYMPLAGVERMIRRVSLLSPGDVEEIAIHFRGAIPGLASARAEAIRLMPASWAEAKEMLVTAFAMRRLELGDDLPWDDARSAALDALRVVLAQAELTEHAQRTLAAAWCTLEH